MENDTNQARLEWQNDVLTARTQIQKERDEASRYVKIRDGEIRAFTMTGRYARQTSKFNKSQMCFELEEKSGKGENRILAFSAQLDIVQELLGCISEGKLSQSVMRSGSGTSDTRYTRVKN